MLVKARCVKEVGTVVEDMKGRWSRATDVTDSIELDIYTMYNLAGADLGGGYTTTVSV